MRIEWDPEKDRTNRSKHGLGFDEAHALFEGDVDYLVIYDEAHSDAEDRFIAIGPISRGVITVAFAEPADDVIRIITARMATRQEAEAFYAAMGGEDR